MSSILLPQQSNSKSPNRGDQTGGVEQPPGSPASLLRVAAAAAMATPDLLFNLRNLFYLGAYQAAINNSDVPGLDADAAAERDAIVFRSYIALGSYQVRADRYGVWFSP